MADDTVRSWNRLPKARHERVAQLADRFSPLPLPPEPLTVLPFGNGRSYGDVCLNDGGGLIATRRLDHFIAFDETAGILTCESGVSLDEILALVVPRGWFLSVTPGTRFVTVGGAIANDVHGKNHHRLGSFGHHVLAFELLRSDGRRLLCSATENPDWFRATIGGLGLTGLVTWARLRLQRIPGPWLETRSWRFGSLDEFWALDGEARGAWPYTVAWIDCVAGRRGRGILMAGRHAPADRQGGHYVERRRRMPFDPPFSLVNALSVRLFNIAYYRRPAAQGMALTHFQPYFYPLDAVRDWNRIYGRRGFYQYQCVLPPAAAAEGIGTLLARITESGEGSFLAVLKTFGDMSPAGMLSFPREGVTLALDFPDHGARTLRLFEDLDAIVTEAGGALYPAKDARMPAAMFRRGFPRWEAFAPYVDPRFSSGFWRRMGGEECRKS